MTPAHGGRIRRSLVLALALLPWFALPARADESSGEWRHGHALIGALKYDADFARFAYVNPDAPKGGGLVYAAVGDFDSLNPFLLKGNAAAGLGLIYESLMTSSLDEPAAQYGLLAEAVAFPRDFSSATFRLRAGAKWHDGTPVTTEDVAWSFTTLREHYWLYRDYYADVGGFEILSPREIRFDFTEANNRELPHIMGQLLVLPRHHWQGGGREFDAASLEPPLASGPYRIGAVQAGRSITYERVADYWGADLPVNVGQNNFDSIRIEYFRDDTISLQAFLAGEYDWRAESTAKNWANGYDSPALQRGDIIKEEFHDGAVAGMQAFVFNIRREKFADARVRRAFDLAFDFEWSNRTLFHGQYKRNRSYFDNSELASRGLPEGRELEILQRHRASLPVELFTTPYETPVTDGSGNNRDNLRRAKSLLEAAGWHIRDGALTHESSGEVMEVEFLIVRPTFERVLLPYQRNLERLGIALSLRLVDSVQYGNRVQEFDYDMIVGSFGQSMSPGNEQRDFWGSAAAARPGSRNLIGIADAMVDELVEEIVFAEDREHLIAATRALDRVLLWGHYVVPNWHSSASRIAYWRHLHHPEAMPPFSVGFPSIWWHREEE